MDAEIFTTLAAVAAGGGVVNAVIAYLRSRVSRGQGHRLVVSIDDRNVIVREDFKGTPHDLDAVEDALQRQLAQDE